MSRKNIRRMKKKCPIFIKIASAQLQNMYYKEYTNFHKKKINVVIKKKLLRTNTCLQTDGQSDSIQSTPPPPTTTNLFTMSVGS